MEEIIMRKATKTAALVLAMTMAVSALTACGSGADKTTGADVTGTENAEAAAGRYRGGRQRRSG